MAGRYVEVKNNYKPLNQRVLRISGSKPATAEAWSYGRELHIQTKSEFGWVHVVVQVRFLKPKKPRAPGKRRGK